MKTLVPIALIVALIVSLTQASNVHEDQRKSVDEVQDKDEASYACEAERTEDDLSEDDSPDDVEEDEEDEEDEGDTQDEGAGDEEDFDDEEDLEREMGRQQDPRFFTGPKPRVRLPKRPLKRWRQRLSWGKK